MEALLKEVNCSLEVLGFAVSGGRVDVLSFGEHLEYSFLMHYFYNNIYQGSMAEASLANLEVKSIYKKRKGI